MEEINSSSVEELVKQGSPPKVKESPGTSRPGVTHSRLKIAAVLGLLLVVILSLVGYKMYRQITKPKAKETKTIVKQELVRRSVNPEIIQKATTAKAIDVNTGRVITAVSLFTLDDKTVYLALELNSPKVGTSLDYIRYLNGRYVEHGNVQIQNEKTDHLTFNWTNTRPLGSVGDGKWRIATYTNGILEKSVNYVVQKNKVTSMTVEEPNLGYVEYYLEKALSFAKGH